MPQAPFNSESIGVPSRCGACLSRAIIGVMDANVDGDPVQWIYCSACGQRSPAYKAGDHLMFGDWFAVQQVYRRDA